MADLLQFPLPLFDPEPPTEPVQEPPPGPPEPHNTLALTDPESRLAALDIRRSWIVEAPAGSGKTGLLIQRFLKLLGFSDLERPGEVLAITFTRKAANELRTRVLEQLAAASRSDPLPPNAGEYERSTRHIAEAALARDRERGWRLLESPHQLNIRTIDSFCGDLAGRLPLLSGGAGSRRPIDDAAPLYEEAARRALRELGGPDPTLSDALRCVLLHRDAQVNDCVRLIADMLANREQWGKLVPLDASELQEQTLDTTVRQRLERTLERAVCRGLTRAARAIDPDLLHELAHFAARLGSEPGYNGQDSPIALCAGLPHAPGTSADNLEHWLALLKLLLREDGGWRTGVGRNHLRIDLTQNDALWLRNLLAHLRSGEQHNPELRQALCALRCLPPPRYPDDQWRVAKALFHVLRRAWAELSVLFAERGVCDFTELALTARSLLASDTAQSDLLHTPGAQLTHLLVDEMQDTSAGQYELLELLTRQWDGRTQTLFLVGDPKQSIYEFRQARVERFLRTQLSRQFGHVPLLPLRLTANFRSQAVLVQQFNETFGRILPAPEEMAETGPGNADVPFVAASPVRPRGTEPALRWHVRVESSEAFTPVAADDGDPDPDHPLPTAEEDAAAIRRLVEEFLDRRNSGPNPPSPKNQSPRVAILARTRAHLAPIIAEFRRNHGRGTLPFRAVEIEVLNERPEVLDLLALTRALLHPGDRIAWLAVLHSPVCGLGRADLLALTGEGPSADPNATVAHLVETNFHRLSPEGQQLLRRAWPILSEAQSSLGRTLFSTDVERTWRSLGADALLRPDQLTNTRRFLRLLHDLEAGSEPLSLPLLERRLRKLYAEPFSGTAAVELMTIHKAKGLEWDLVIVPSLESGAGNSRHELLKWLELDGKPGAEAEVVLAPIAGKGEESSPLSGWLTTLQRSRETAEAKRLFYVACTRAREELHLFATCLRKQGGGLRQPRHDTLLLAAWAAAEPIILQGQTASAPPTHPNTPVIHAWPHPAVLPDYPVTPLALAASADLPETPDPAATEHPLPPQIQRLPADFDPLERFRPEHGPGLPYPPASTLRHGAPFARPEGSFAARAFGNVVHRFLELASERLATNCTAGQLLAELPGWRPRLATAFRAEGLPPALCQRDAERALLALRATLDSPEGRWLLSPHTGARSERSLQVGADGGTEVTVRNLRADRVFLAGPDPLSEAESHLWIVDFKTAEPGGRPAESFLASEKAKYLPQMQAYARASAAASDPHRPIILALFYPAMTQLLYWTFEPRKASQQIESSTDTVPR